MSSQDPAASKQEVSKPSNHYRNNKADPWAHNIHLRSNHEDKKIPDKLAFAHR